MPRVPILVYHEVSAEPAPAFRRYTVTPDQFEQQLRWLTSMRYVGVSIDELLQWRADRRRFDGRPVALTFDDGFVGAVDHATRMLRQRGFKATFYLVSGHLGGRSSWTKDRRQIELPIITAARARQLVSDGFSCGAHSVNHQRLTELPLERCQREIEDSKTHLEDDLGCAISDFAYPYGASNTDVRRCVVEAGYRSAVTTESTRSRPTDDLFALPRITVCGDESLRDFKLRVLTGNRLDAYIPPFLYALGAATKRRIGRH